jgi:hypothetical protein
MVTVTMVIERSLKAISGCKHLCIVLLLSASFLSAKAQYSDAGIQIGVSRYKGELSPHLFDTKFIHPAFGIFYRHNWTRYWSYKLEFNYGRVSGNDNQQTNAFEIRRNLNFYSDIYDLTNAFEFNFLEYELGNRGYSFTPYIFSGFTFFYFNPKSDLNGQTVNLQPLGTEGQGLDGNPKFYHRLNVAIPIGGGLKFALGSLGIALQVSARRTYSDYIDDVSTTYPDMAHLGAARGPVAVYFSDPSVYKDTAMTVPSITGKQRGDSSENDWYVFGTVCIYVRLSSFIKEFCKPFKVRRYS